MNDWDFEDYYEPSEGEMFFNEMKEKFSEILREDVNTELSRLTKENAELREVVKEYNDKKNGIIQKRTRYSI